MLECFYVGMGGFIGAISRYLLGLLPWVGSFPLITLLVNLLGAIIIGIISEAAGNIPELNKHLLMFLRVGFCGGFTTFSTFALESMKLLDGGRIKLAFLYILLSVALCLLGIIIGRSLFHGTVGLFTIR